MLLINLLNKLNRYLVLILRHLAIWILTSMMLLTAADVCLRYVFNSPVTGSFELVEFMMALIVPFSIVFCASERAHIHVDILLEHLPEGARSFFIFLGNILSLFLFVLITWQACIYIIEQYQSTLAEIKEKFSSLCENDQLKNGLPQNHCFPSYRSHCSSNR